MSIFIRLKKYAFLCKTDFSYSSSKNQSNKRTITKYNFKFNIFFFVNLEPDITYFNDLCMSLTDITAPSFGNTCPSDMLIHAEKGTTARTISFNVPNPTDNSGEKPNITTFGVPSGAQFKNNQVTYKFKQGQYIVRYVATDLAGNEAECSFKIEVQGRRCNQGQNNKDDQESNKTKTTRTIKMTRTITKQKQLEQLELLEQQGRQ